MGLLSVRIPSGEEPKSSGRIVRGLHSAPKTLLVIHCAHRCDPICSEYNNVMSNNDVTIQSRRLTDVNRFVY